MDSIHAHSLRSLDGCQVLVVEDDSDTRQIMKFVLEQNGAVVEAVDSVNSALTQFRSKKPDVIVADIAMPGLNGFALIAEVRKIDAEVKTHTQVIAVTAFSSPQDRDRAISAGFDQYLTKPFDPSELINAVRQV